MRKSPSGGARSAPDRRCRRAGRRSPPTAPAGGRAPRPWPRPASSQEIDRNGGRRGDDQRQEHPEQRGEERSLATAAEAAPLGGLAEQQLDPARACSRNEGAREGNERSQGRTPKGDD